MRDLNNNVTIQHALDPQLITATPTNGSVVDRQGFDAIEHVVFVGTAGVTLTGAKGYKLILQHGDLAGGTDMADVTDVEYVVGQSTISNGEFGVLDATPDDNQAYKIGYVGPKRYSRVRVEIVGTPGTATPFSGAALKGVAADLPVA